MLWREHCFSETIAKVSSLSDSLEEDIQLSRLIFEPEWSVAIYNLFNL